MKPLDLLTQELERYKRAKQSSIDAMNEGKITPELHEQYIRNLDSLIKEYKDAVDTLIDFPTS